jgi:hypothetical protein
MTDDQSTDIVNPSRRSEQLRRASSERGYPYSNSPDYTHGDYETEKEAEDDLDAALARFGMFTVHKEVVGCHLQPRLGQEVFKPRIDRLLIPNASAVAAGWTHGAVGVEVKRTFEKVGRPMAQMIDYSRCAFRIKPSGISVIPSYVFLFNYSTQGGPLASVFAQQRLGGLSWDGKRLFFQTGQDYLALFDTANGGEIRINLELAQGTKAGSR